jgi:hypothetical protein
MATSLPANPTSAQLQAAGYSLQNVSEGDYGSMQWVGPNGQQIDPSAIQQNDAAAQAAADAAAEKAGNFTYVMAGATTDDQGNTSGGTKVAVPNADPNYQMSSTLANSNLFSGNLNANSESHGGLSTLVNGVNSGNYVVQGNTLILGNGQTYNLQNTGTSGIMGVSIPDINGGGSYAVPIAVDSSSGKASIPDNFLTQGVQYVGGQSGGFLGNVVSGLASALAPIAPVLSLASVAAPELAPIAAAVNTGEAVANNNPFAALTSATGIPGVSDTVGSALGSTGADVTSALKTANAANNLVNAAQSGNALGVLSSGAALTGAGSNSVSIPGTDSNISISDALKAANLVQAASSGNPNSITAAAAALAGSALGSNSAAPSSPVTTSPPADNSLPFGISLSNQNPYQSSDSQSVSSDTSQANPVAASGPVAQPPAAPPANVAQTSNLINNPDGSTTLLSDDGSTVTTNTDGTASSTPAQPGGVIPPVASSLPVADSAGPVETSNLGPAAPPTNLSNPETNPFAENPAGPNVTTDTTGANMADTNTTSDNGSDPYVSNGQTTIPTQDIGSDPYVSNGGSTIPNIIQTGEVDANGNPTYVDANGNPVDANGNPIDAAPTTTYGDTSTSTSSGTSGAGTSTSGSSTSPSGSNSISKFLNSPLIGSLTGAGALTGAAGLAGLLALIQSDNSKFGTPGKATYSGPLTKYNLASNYQANRPDPNAFRPTGVTTVAQQQAAAQQAAAPAQAAQSVMSPFAQFSGLNGNQSPMQAMAQMAGQGGQQQGQSNPMQMLAQMAGFASGGTASSKPQYTSKAQLATMDPWTRAAAEYQNDAYTAQSPTAPVAAPTGPTLGQLNLSGGGLGSYSDGGHLLKGPGDGMSDSIPATIGGKRPARLGDGEFVVPADVVSHLGNGSTEAGARELYKMMDQVRHARTGRKAQGKQINPGKFIPK